MKILTPFLLFLTLLFPLQACAHEPGLNKNVFIEVIADDGTVYPVYDVAHTRRDARHVKRAYLEAIDGKNYKIRVRNLSSQRIGLVIAVDGRNIISGDKSHLKHTERMYILPAYGQAIFDGWRTDQNQVHRFFFTAVENSYAEAFGDKSAMGVIALAVFNEKQQKKERKKLHPRLNKSIGSLNESPAMEAEDSIARSDSSVAREGLPKAAPKAGTGFGEETYSPVTLVQFRANRNPVEKHFYKYEWREALCMKHIVHCRQPENRFWSDDHYSKNTGGYGYAPYPPSQK